MAGNGSGLPVLDWATRASGARSVVDSAISVNISPIEFPPAEGPGGFPANRAIREQVIRPSALQYHLTDRVQSSNLGESCSPKIPLATATKTVEYKAREGRAKRKVTVFLHHQGESANEQTSVSKTAFADGCCGDRLVAWWGRWWLGRSRRGFPDGALRLDGRLPLPQPPTPRRPTLPRAFPRPFTSGRTGLPSVVMIYGRPLMRERPSRGPPQGGRGRRVPLRRHVPPTIRNSAASSARCRGECPECLAAAPGGIWCGGREWSLTPRA